MVQAMQNDEAAKKAMAAAGLDLITMSRPQFAAFVKDEYARWEKIVQNAGVEKQ
jgi:tripartite-type tricarboxylate transporter receptor subunit TctC